jgi:hypothetical protein
MRRRQQIHDRGAMNEMKSIAAAVLLTLAAAGRAGAQQGAFLARFDGGIGVDPLATFSGTAVSPETFPEVVRNTVRGINPAGISWRIADLKADVYTDGRVKVTGRGLVTASGQSIGQNGNNESVSVTLICVGEGSVFSVFSSERAGVPLAPNGDFQIDDVLLEESFQNPVPSECVSPVLLVRSHRTGRWLAAGVTADKNHQ